MFLKLIATRIEEIGCWLLFPTIWYTAVFGKSATALTFTYVFIGMYLVRDIIRKEYRWLFWHIFCLVANLIIFSNPLKEFFNW